MKKSPLLTVAIVCLLTTSVFAASTPFHKFKTGVKEVVTGPFSILTIPIKETSREHDKVLGLLGGIMEGAVQTVVVPLQGVFKILTSPFNYD